MAKLPTTRRQKRQQRVLKDLAAAVEAAAKEHSDGESPNKRKEHSTLLEEHGRVREDEPGMANSSPTAQADSTLLMRAEGDRPSINRSKQRGFKHSAQLMSSALIRRERPHSSAQHAPDSESNQIEQEPARRSLQPIVHRRISRSALCTLISSSRILSSTALLGTLRAPTTETQLPLLDAQTQSALSASSTSGLSVVEISIRHSDELPFGAYSAPVIHLHVVDKCTGRSLQPTMVSETGRLRDGPNGNNAFWWNETLKLAVDAHDTLSPRTVLLFEILEEKKPRHFRSLRGATFEELKSSQPEFEEGEQNDETRATLPLKVKRIAWGFLHGITDHGGLTLPQLIPTASETSTSKPTNVRLQLFQYQLITWMDQYQAKKQWGWRKNHPTMPSVFLQYQKRSRLTAPSTLYLRMALGKSRQSHSIVRQASTRVTNSAYDISNLSVSGGDFALPPSQDAESNPKPVAEISTLPLHPPRKDLTETSKPDWITACRRDKLEPCLVPQRILHSLPSGKQGCSTIAFSPCGRFLGAGVRTGLGDCHLNVYDVNTGARLCIGRGHGGIIYSLDWSEHDTNSHDIVSASSDGTARLWRLINGNEQLTGISLVFEWHHVPAPIHVYCAIFHPFSGGGVVSGASDGHVRFYDKDSYAISSSASVAKLKASEAAIHSIRIDASTKRLFCGDGEGTISVYSCCGDPTDVSKYVRLKVIATGQSSITSLQLHPRKSHLLVHAQPNTLLQYELRSYLLLNRSYAGVVCEQTLGHSVFSPDGKWVACGTEDGTPRLFTSLHGEQVVKGVWGLPFFHGTPISDVAWSPTAHIVALCSYGRNSPIVVLAATHEDGDSSVETGFDELWSRAQRAVSLDNNDDPILGGNSGFAATLPPLELPADDHTRRVQQILERRRKRLEAQTTADPGSDNTYMT